MFQYGTDEEISNFLQSAVMDETIHVLQKEQEMGNIKASRACFPFKLSLVYIHIYKVTWLTGITGELFSL